MRYPARIMVIVLMGVAGAGKTTIGRLLAQRLGWRFYDADDLHPAANREKMRNGIALTDADRRPWLEAVRDEIARCLSNGENAVIACSALKSRYRNLLGAPNEYLRFVYLKGSIETLAARLAARRDHFFPEQLLKSQLETLEEPEDALIENIDRSPAEIVESIRRRVGI
jgi:carbohydrate kinase (thermoresistant glucokinase family)